MGIFRIGRRWGVWLALFALGLQLVLSFGHIHAGDVATSGRSVAALTAPATDHAPDDDGDRHDGCAICATMHLAAASLVPPPPQVATPATTFTLITFAPQSAATARSPVQPFNARAPPQA